MGKKIDDLLIAVEESDSSLSFFNLADHKEEARIKTGFWPHEIEVSKDGRTAYVTNFGIKDYDERIGSPGCSISVIDIATRCEIKRLYTFRNHEEYKRFRAPHGLKLNPTGDRLYVNIEGEDEEMMIFDLKTDNAFPISTFAMSMEKTFSLEPLENDTYDIPQGTHNFIFSQEGSFIFLSSGINGLYKIDATDGAVVANILAEKSSPVRGLAYDRSKEHLIVSGRNKISIVDPDSMMVLNEFSDFGVTQILYAQPSPDGKYILAPAVWESVVLVIDFSSGAVVERIPVGIDPIHVAFSSAGSYAYVSHGRTKYIAEIDLEKFEVTNKIPTKGGPNGLAVVPYIGLPKKKVLKIGACLPLSGPSATEGREIRLGYQFWEERTNESGGIFIDGKAYQVEILFKDTLSRSMGDGDKEYIQELATELIHGEKVEIMFGTYPTPPNEYLAQLADQFKIPLIIATGAGENIYDKGYDYTYGIMSPAKIYLSGTISLLMDDDSISEKPGSILFLSCNDNAALQDAKATAEFAVQKGLQLVHLPESPLYKKVHQGVYAYEHLDDNFDEMVRLIKTSAPDLFFNTGHLAESLALFQSILDNQFHPKGIAFSVGPTIPAFRERFRDRSKYLFGSAQWNEFAPISGQDEFETPQNYAKAFYERFSMPVSYFSAGAYACGIVLKEAILKTGSLNSQEINEALKKTDMLSFFAGIKFDHRGLNVTKPIITVQIQPDTAGNIAEIPVYPVLFSISKPIYPLPG